LRSLVDSHTCVKIDGEIVHPYPVKEPMLQLGKDFSVAGLVELAEKAAIGTLGRHLVPSEYGMERLVVPEPITMDISGCPCPDPQPKRFYNMLG